MGFFIVNLISLFKVQHFAQIFTEFNLSSEFHAFGISCNPVTNSTGIELDPGQTCKGTC